MPDAKGTEEIIPVGMIEDPVHFVEQENHGGVCFGKHGIFNEVGQILLRSQEVVP